MSPPLAPRADGGRIAATFQALKQAACEALAAAAEGAAGRQERALAREARKVVEGWEWPAGRIATPPPSPFWRMLGLES